MWVSVRALGLFAEWICRTMFSQTPKRSETAQHAVGQAKSTHNLILWAFFFFSMLPSFAGIVPGNTSRYLKNTGKESEFSGCSVCIWGFLITLSSHTADKKPSLTTMLHIKTAPGGQKKNPPAQHWLWSALFVGTIVMSVTLTYILVFRGTFTLTLTLT